MHNKSFKKKSEQYLQKRNMGIQSFTNWQQKQFEHQKHPNNCSLQRLIVSSQKNSLFIFIYHHPTPWSNSLQPHTQTNKRTPMHIPKFSFFLICNIIILSSMNQFLSKLKHKKQNMVILSSTWTWTSTPLSHIEP